VSRLEQLLKFVEEEPNDPFNLYAVAIEYSKLDLNKAEIFYRQLLEKHPDYLPTFYSFGKLLVEKNDKVNAKEVFAKGIALAEKLKDAKALRELKNALNELEFDLDN
jgi:hypothetical protein